MLKYVLLFTIATVSSLLLTPWVRRLALHFGVVDRPGGRRIHSAPTPRLGGIVVYASALITFLLGSLFDSFIFETLVAHSERVAALALGGTIVMALGLVDDVRSLGPGAKLVTQLAAGVVVIATGYRVEVIASMDLGLWGLAVTLLWVVGITNAFNLIDGLDGLSAGIGLIVASTLFAISMYSGNVESALILAVLGGALLGFLRYNFYPARIFLGDSGSLFLGFILAVVSIGATSRLSAVVAIAVPILALGLPIAETALTVVRRLLRIVHVVRRDAQRERYEFLFLGRTALLRADRGHIHHRLLDLGITHRNAVLVLYGICTLLSVAALAIVVERAPNEALLLVAFGIAAVIGIRRLDYGEMHVLRNGTLLPIFDFPLVNQRLLHVLLDLTFIVASDLGANLIRAEGLFTPDVRQSFLETIPLVGLVQIASFTLSGLYRRSYRYTGIADLFTVLRSLGLACAASWVALSALEGWRLPSLTFWVLDGYLLATLVIGTRLSFRILEHVFQRERDAGSRVLIYGAGKAGVLALREIQDNPSVAMRPIGFLDDDPGKQMRIVAGCPVYAPEALEGLISSRQFDELIVASSKIDPQRVQSIAERCALAGIGVRRFSIGWEEVRDEGVNGSDERASAGGG